MVYFFASQPVAPNRCRGFCVIGAQLRPRTTRTRRCRSSRTVIFGQDQRVVESQRPEQVPFDLADELHLQFDAVAIAYRKAMQTEQLGVARRFQPERLVNAWPVHGERILQALKELRGGRRARVARATANESAKSAWARRDRCGKCSANGAKLYTTAGRQPSLECLGERQGAGQGFIGHDGDGPQIPGHGRMLSPHLLG